MARIVLIVGFLVSVLLAGAAPQESRSRQTAPKPAVKTGCIDEQDGRYVLIHDQTRELIVKLEAEGFPTEGFAKHLGHKVTVRGTASPEGSDPVFKVRSIETVSENCGPEH